MKIVVQKTIPLLVIEFVIGLIRDQQVVEHGKEIVEEGGNFRLSDVPKDVLEKLEIGDKIRVLCIPDLGQSEEESSCSSHVLFLVRIRDEKPETLMGAFTRWEHEYYQMMKSE